MTLHLHDSQPARAAALARWLQGQGHTVVVNPSPDDALPDVALCVAESETWRQVPGGVSTLIIGWHGKEVFADQVQKETGINPLATAGWDYLRLTATAAEWAEDLERLPTAIHSGGSPAARAEAFQRERVLRHAVGNAVIMHALYHDPMLAMTVFELREDLAQPLGWRRVAQLLGKEQEDTRIPTTWLRAVDELAEVERELALLSDEEPLPEDVRQHVCTALKSLAS